MNEAPAAFDDELTRESAAIVHRRLLPAAGLVVLACVLAAPFELRSQTGERALLFGLLLLGLCAVCVGTKLLARAHPAQVTAIVSLAAMLVAMWTTGYVIVADSSPETLAVSLCGLLVATSLLFPLGLRGQLPVTLTAAAGYPIAASFDAGAIALLALACMTLVHATLQQRARADALQQEARRHDSDKVLSAQKQLLANVSHELRTPLNAMLGYLEMLSDGAFGALPRESKDPLQRVQSNAEMLLRLTTDLLDLSRLQADRFTLNLESVDLATVCTEASDLLGGELLGKPLEVIPDVTAGTAAYADRDRLRQVLANLLGNAIKFTSQGHIRIRGFRDADGWARIEVHDTGIGIPATELEVIFQPFHRGESAARVGGVGIGLALSRQLTEAMDGTIDVTSTPGVGSTFVVRLPSPPEEHR